MISNKPNNDVPKQIVPIKPKAGNVSKIRGKAALPLLNKGIYLCNKYKIEKMIGGGGFGQIFRATDMISGIVVAVKVELETSESSRMVLEQIVLSKLIGLKNSPNIFYAGSINGINYIVMQMLGKNLSDLRKANKTRRLSVHTVIRIGLQMLDALECLHGIGYLHRDIKPSNICTGIGEHRRIIYLVDYGMARLFRRPDGEWRRERKYAGFRGTARYVSLAVHERHEQNPADDLWSLYYSLIELAESLLPWRNETNHETIRLMKASMLCQNTMKFGYLPKQFLLFYQYLIRSPQNQLPNYDELRDILRHCCKFVDEEAEFEWDDEKPTQGDD